MERRSDPRILLGFALPLWLIMLSPGRNRRKHYGLLVPPTDNVYLIFLLCGSGRGEFMDLVPEGVLSHPSACHGPCIFPSSFLLQEVHCSPVNTEHFNKHPFSAVVYPFCLRGFEFPANPSTGNSLFWTVWEWYSAGWVEVFALSISDRPGW